jgi:hypothetical protein
MPEVLFGSNTAEVLDRVKVACQSRVLQGLTTDPTPITTHTAVLLPNFNVCRI